jgi:hypothetical protein
MRLLLRPRIKYGAGFENEQKFCVKLTFIIKSSLGVVKLAPTLPMDGNFPFMHLDRKFMHLGFHIYDVGFQSPNVEAARPLVYATALLLVMVIIGLNLFAVSIRNRLREKNIIYMKPQVHKLSI